MPEEKYYLINISKKENPQDIIFVAYTEGFRDMADIAKGVYKGDPVLDFEETGKISKEQLFRKLEEILEK